MNFVNTLVSIIGGKIVQESQNRILVINPGSTSTKIGVFDGETAVLENAHSNHP